MKDRLPETMAVELFPETLLVSREGEHIYTTSRSVAWHFGKNHQHVLRTTKKLIIDLSEMEVNESNFGLVKDFTAHHFVLTAYLDSKGEKRPEYYLSEEGFALLAMGFTGKEALRWKVAFLQAFRQMESDLADMQQRYVAALDQVRPALRPAVEGVQAGLPRLATAQSLGKSVRAISYHRRQARRFGLLPAYEARRQA